VVSTQRFDTRHFNQLSASLEQHMARYGYRKVDTPVIQPADLFLTRAGDQIIDHLFTFERRGQQYALRPEFTASAAAQYAQQQREGDVARWQFNGAIFEDDPASTSTSYQRFGIGAELLGMAGALAEAEIIAMAAHGLTGQGMRDWTLTLGNVQLMRHLLATFRLDSRAQRFLLAHLPALVNPALGKPFVLEALDKLLMGGADAAPITGVGLGEEGNTQQMLDVLLDATQRGATMGGRTRHDIARRLVQKRQRAAERDQFARALDFLAAWSEIDLPCPEAFVTIRGWISPDDAVALAVLDDWRHLINLLTAYGLPGANIRLQPALSRNWDYYTGIVFELRAADQRRLGGGGRYDELARLLGAEHDVPAVGFTYYADELLALLPPAAEESARVLTLVVPPESEIDGVRWSQALRQRGYDVTVSRAAEDQSAALVQSDGRLLWAGSLYSLDAIDQFVASLERQTHE
jgi:ATP phosphoribosyltransferase regulatory subunit HisZ